MPDLSVRPMFRPGYSQARQPVVSVITPAYSPNEDYLRALHKSLCAQEIPWEWVVQEDGEPEGARIPG